MKRSLQPWRGTESGPSEAHAQGGRGAGGGGRGSPADYHALVRGAAWIENVLGA